MVSYLDSGEEETASSAQDKTTSKKEIACAAPRKQLATSGVFYRSRLSSHGLITNGATSAVDKQDSAAVLAMNHNASGPKQSPTQPLRRMCSFGQLS